MNKINFFTGFSVGSCFVSIIYFKKLKKRVLSFANLVTIYNTNLSIMQTREQALITLMEPFVDQLSEDAIIEYNTTVEFLDLIEFNDIRNPI